MATLSVISVVGPGAAAAASLEATFASLVRQSVDSWEWLVVRVGNAAVGDIIAADGRVRLMNASAAAEAGASHMASSLASGDYVLDLDVGDTLVANAIERFAEAGSAAGASGAVYCDVANVPVDGPPAGYAPAYGWEKYEVLHDTGVVDGIRAFPVTASSMLQASYAPSYGVAWKRTLYQSLGGRNDSLGAAAVYDLSCRAFLTGAEFTHTPHCLVFSRRHHTFVRDLTAEDTIANRFRIQIIGEWSRRNGLRMLDLGAAHNPTPGFESVDLQDASVNCDIRRGLPLPDNSVGCIRAYDFLEHMNHCPDSACTHGADGGLRCCVGVMNEFYRVLAPGGWLISRTPSSDGRGAFQDPTHVSYWNPNSFWYYTRRDQARFVRGITCRFQAARVWQDYPDEWHRQNHILYVYAELVALKGQRQPGICEI